MACTLIEIFHVLAVLVCLTESKTLPDYVDKCSVKDPVEFTKCALASATKILPHLMEGDEKNKIHSLNPFEIAKLRFDSINGLKMYFSDAKFYGLNTTVIENIKYDKTSRRLFFDANLDFVEMKALYSMQGKILVLPIEGNGTGTIRLDKPYAAYSVHLSPTKNDQMKEVIKIQEPQLELKVQGLRFELNNLFNGNEALGKQTLTFLNENWQEIFKEFRVIFDEIISSAGLQVFGEFLNGLTYDEVFNDV